MTAQEAYNKTEAILKAYAEGDLHGGNPMQFIEQYAREISDKKNKSLTRKNRILRTGLNNVIKSHRLYDVWEYAKEAIEKSSKKTN